MATIKPFQGIRYNLDKVRDMSKVVTPPYDVISPQEQESYYRLHEQNIIRLTKGKDLPGDNDQVNKYARAASFFKEWLNKGILQKDPKPAIYIYEQTFDINNKPYSRKGFISNIKLEELNTGHIFPHEQTLSGPKADRRKLIEACSSSFCCVFSLYQDTPTENGTVRDVINANSSRTPDISFIDDKEVKNMLWVVTETDTINKIVTLMRDKPLFIADGHHRYETALSYRNSMRESNKNNKSAQNDPGYDYIMMMCVAMDDPGLKILPAHRVIKNVNGIDTAKIKSKLSEIFTLHSIENRFSANDITEKLKENADKHAFILYLRDEKKYYLLILEKEKFRNTQFDLEYSNWQYFDVGILHGIVFDKLLGIKNIASTNESGLEYVKNESDVVSMVDNDGYQMAFFLNPTNIKDLQMVANNRQIMPPKSTYFYPKLITGMVISQCK